MDTDSDPQITLITLMFKKLAWSDRLKEWEPLRNKNKRAYFCAPGFPIVPKAQPWDPRVAAFPAILAFHRGHPVNPVQNSCPLGMCGLASTKPKGEGGSVV
ncbi:MAG: hypothetical protein AMK69_19980 [Nitrospira bacterium SG8_3]|nr:MAG: hypothetical protein AMK69_19980 [Nitrospira bacterium SG8_3]